MFERLEVSFDCLFGDSRPMLRTSIKTPLSLIRLQSEKLLLHAQLPSGQHEALQQQLESISRLDSVIEQASLSG